MWSCTAFLKRIGGVLDVSRPSCKSFCCYVLDSLRRYSGAQRSLTSNTGYFHYWGRSNSLLLKLYLHSFLSINRFFGLWSLVELIISLYLIPKRLGLSINIVFKHLEVWYLYCVLSVTDSFSVTFSLQLMYLYQHFSCFFYFFIFVIFPS